MDRWRTTWCVNKSISIECAYNYVTGAWGARADREAHVWTGARRRRWCYGRGRQSTTTQSLQCLFAVYQYSDLQVLFLVQSDLFLLPPVDNVFSFSARLSVWVFNTQYPNCVKQAYIYRRSWCVAWRGILSFWVRLILLLETVPENAFWNAHESKFSPNSDDIFT